MSIKGLTNLLARLFQNRFNLMFLVLYIPAAQAFAILSIVFVAFYTLDSFQDRIKSAWDVEDTFDFIVVGAGSAGAVVANRLSENFKVLVLEAGGEPNPLHRIPLLALPLLQVPQADWGYYTIPQKNACLAMKSRRCSWPRGRSLGGSSNLNFMIYIRGHKYDYESWANISGDPRWRYENVLEYFKKSENYNGEWDIDRFHSHGGYLDVKQPPYEGMAETYCKAAEEMGVPRLDLNADFTEGCSPIYYTQRNGRRSGTYHAFLKPVKDRKNLFIRKYSHVTKVLFQGSRNYAVGVEYIHHGRKKFAFAANEVILSAGAINSPQILMLSGVGPKVDLESLQIKVLADRPVGKNLQDHVSSLVGPFIVDEPISVDLDKNLTVSALLSFAKRGEGILSSTSIQATSFFVSDVAKSRNQSDWPDIQHLLMGHSLHAHADLYYSRNFNTRLDVMRNFFKGASRKHSFQIMNIPVRPFSKGQIRLADTDPMTPPLLHPNYFENELDVKVIVEGAKRAVDLVENSPTFKALNGKLHNVAFPGCENIQFRSDAYWECYHRQFSLTVYHQCGTCAMGKRDSPDAVVDSELRVIGTKNLRVIDASIMPHLTTGNTNAPTIMIAEMGADMIKSTWQE